MWNRPQKGTKVTKRLLCLLCLFVAIPSAPSQIVEEQIGLRLIAARTEAEAAGLLSQIQSGRSFEAIAKAQLFRLSDLKADIQRVVIGLTPGQISPITPISGEFFIIQRLTFEEANWIASYGAGLAAFEKARYEEAARNFLEALPYAEKLTPVDERLEDNLHGLAEAYRLEKKDADAEPFYRKYLALHWGGPSAPEVLDRLSMLLTLSYFQDSQFEEARRRFLETVEHSPPGEGLFTAMSSILFDAQLVDEAEAIMERAAQLFATSRGVHYRLAELYRRSWKPRKALEVFERVGRMSGANASPTGRSLQEMKASGDIDPAVDRLQRSVVYQKIGSIHTELAELEQAASAYRKALEFTPDSVDAQLGLGDVYLQQGRTEDSLNEYNRALAMDPKSPAAYFRVADANLRMGRFPEASAAAAKVLAFDAGHRKARYVLATALVRMGAKEEGDRELEVYRKLEAEARSETDSGRNIVVVNRGAAVKLLEGRAEEAVEMFLKAIETSPDSATPYLNLGTAQSKLGQHKAAADTFQKMLALNLDSFLVSWNLAQEYQSLGDIEASRRHRVVYLQNIDGALREALESNLE
jgi:tetratricopeptide (TPR) repeat protein